MALGKLDTLIVIQAATFARNSTTGQMAPTYSTFESVWAEKVNKQSLENELTQQITSDDVEVFRIRYISGVTKKMRIYDAELARYYDITGISMEGRKRYLLITAKSVNVNAPV